MLVSALGDSITAGTPAWDPDPSVRERLASPLDPQSQYPYWAERRAPRFKFRNCGVDEETSDEIAGRLDRSIEGADILIVQGGINDIVRGRSVARAAENVRSMLRRGRSLGLHVFVVDILPWNNGYPDADPQIRLLNELLRRVGADEHVPLIPFHRTLEDPKRPGRMRAEWTADGSHPSVEGHRRLGAAVAEVLERSLSRQRRGLST